MNVEKRNGILRRLVSMREYKKEFLGLARGIWYNDCY